ncbi:unnamed protein product [Microthlaspi erraticum]|uniref:Uncharacterized protein n=1 Tax=Microthlaspi erraticum TaxID=1685480 RepID=A0A6D2KGA6_9BRAS|nr:unnamed protein product [Microthlaspi erraticum]
MAAERSKLTVLLNVILFAMVVLVYSGFSTEVKVRLAFKKTYPEPATKSFIEGFLSTLGIGEAVHIFAFLLYYTVRKDCLITRVVVDELSVMVGCVLLGILSLKIDPYPAGVVVGFSVVVGAYSIYMMIRRVVAVLRMRNEKIRPEVKIGA